MNISKKMNNNIKNNFIKNIISLDLKNNKYKIIKTRFPPEPNGYLHIGHAKSICLNFEIAKEYNGYCYLRFDDTNPEKEKLEYINSIQKDIRWLGFNWNKSPNYTSKYFKQIYQYAIDLIKKKLAYVDLLTQTQIREYRGTLTKLGKNSPYRNHSIERNLFLFNKMKNGEFNPGQACLRAKIDMKSPCIIMRDPVLYRILFTKHHQTINQWFIYPTYDFSHCISDSIEGITHSLCTLEFLDNKKIYNWILKNINISHIPHQFEYSRLQLEYTILSKRKLKILVDKKIVNGWNDPRMPTIAGLKKRGYTPNSIRDFCNKIGITKQSSIIEFSFLESCIRKELNCTAIRNMAVLDPIKIIIENFPKNKIETIQVYNNPNKKTQGTHKIFFDHEIYIDKSDFSEKYNPKYRRLTSSTEIRLRHAYIIKVNRIEKDKNNNIVTIFCNYDNQTLGKKPKDRQVNGVIHWVSKKHSLKAKFFLYQNLFNIKNPESKKDFLSYINTNSLVIKKGVIESCIAQNSLITTYQFERIGYFFIEQKNHKNQEWVFNLITSLKQNKFN